MSGTPFLWVSKTTVYPQVSQDSQQTGQRRILIKWANDQVQDFTSFFVLTSNLISNVTQHSMTFLHHFQRLILNQLKSNNEKMKLLYISLALASGQKTLSEQVALAESKCTFFMEKAFDCDPPKSRDDSFDVF